MRSYALLISLIFHTYTFAQTADELALKRAITDPAIGARCNRLLKKRADKIEVKQRLNGLIERNKRLKKLAPKEKKSVLYNLSRNLLRLEQELRLSKLKIEDLEEQIIRKGCPGISL